MKPDSATYAIVTRFVVITLWIKKMAISLFVPVLLLAAFVQYGESVRCWTCTSDLNSHCQDPFQYDSSIDYRIEFCDANIVKYPYLTSSKSACKKQKKYINGDLVVSRGCTWKRQDDFTSACPSSSNGPNEVTYSTKTIGKTVALLLAPLGLLLFK